MNCASSVLPRSRGFLSASRIRSDFGPHGSAVMRLGEESRARAWMFTSPDASVWPRSQFMGAPGERSPLSSLASLDCRRSIPGRAQGVGFTVLAGLVAFLDQPGGGFLDAPSPIQGQQTESKIRPADIG